MNQTTNTTFDKPNTLKCEWLFM